MNDPIRIIKKYPNRRLYDTAASSYVSLEEIKALVLKHIRFKVIDSRTKEEVTNYILLQIITEQENSGTPIFTTEILQTIIRLYGNEFQRILGQYLEQGLQFFIEQQTKAHDLFKFNPFQLTTPFAKQNMSFWESSLKGFHQAAQSQQTSTSSSDRKKKIAKKAVKRKK